MGPFQRIIDSKDPRPLLRDHLSFLAHTPTCRQLLTALVEFVDAVDLGTSQAPSWNPGELTEATTAAHGGSMLRLRLQAGDEQLLIGHPAPKAKSKVPSLAALWKHAERLELNDDSGGNPLILMASSEQGRWVDDNDSLFDGHDGDTERLSTLGASPIQDHSTGDHGPFYVFDPAGKGHGGEPALVKVSRPPWDVDLKKQRPKLGTDVVIGEPLNREFGIGGVFLRVWAHRLLGQHGRNPLKTFFEPFDAVKTRLNTSGPWYLVNRESGRFAKVRVEEDEVWIAEGHLDTPAKAKSRFIPGAEKEAQAAVRDFARSGLVSAMGAQ